MRMIRNLRMVRGSMRIMAIRDLIKMVFDEDQ